MIARRLLPFLATPALAATTLATTTLAATTLGSPRVRGQPDRQGIPADSADAAALGAPWRSDHAQWGEAVRQARITAEQRWPFPAA